MDNNTKNFIKRFLTNSQKVPNFRMLALILAVGSCFPAAARQITDMAGSQVTVADVIRKVYSTSPPAAWLVYAIDPAMVAASAFLLIHPRSHTWTRA